MDEFDMQQHLLDEENAEHLQQLNAEYQPLRRQGNIQGGALLLYKVIMTVAVSAVMIVVAFAEAFALAFLEEPADFDAIMNAMMDAMMNTMGWGYLAAVAFGWLILRLWKKRAFFQQEIYKPGKPMSLGSFVALVCLTFGCQLPAQLLTLALEWMANLFGGSIMEILEANAVDMDNLPMWLYVCLAAPIWEELLFRGLLLRSIEPFGKKFAIIVSAVLFGLYHGNPIQTPYAILVGLILGYVATEYNIVWAMVLHMMNNLLLSDTMTRLLELIPYNVAEIVSWIVLLVFFLAALVVLLLKWRTIVERGREEAVEKWQRKAFWRAPCVVILCISCLLDIGLIILLMFA